MFEIVTKASARCRHCHDEVVGVDGRLRYCSCGRVAVDGPASGRIVGNREDYENTSQVEFDSFAVEMIDLGGAADDHRPTTEELEAAPLLIDWRFSLYPGTQMICMTGFALGHPRLGNTQVTTRPLVALAIDEGWMKTEGRHYKLGPRARD